ncbi:MAG: ISAzo13-like element transposase-related protein [Dehalococcoidia bacterium]
MKRLVSNEVVGKLISGNTSKTGLRVQSALDQNAYPTGVNVKDSEMETLNLRRESFHGEWNYSVLPRQQLLHGEIVS